MDTGIRGIRWGLLGSGMLTLSGAAASIQANPITQLAQSNLIYFQDHQNTTFIQDRAPAWPLAISVKKRNHIENQMRIAYELDAVVNDNQWFSLLHTEENKKNVKAFVKAQRRDQVCTFISASEKKQQQEAIETTCGFLESVTEAQELNEKIGILKNRIISNYTMNGIFVMHMNMVLQCSALAPTKKEMPLFIILSKEISLLEEGEHNELLKDADSKAIELGWEKSYFRKMIKTLRITLENQPPEVIDRALMKLQHLITRWNTAGLMLTLSEISKRSINDLIEDYFCNKLPTNRRCWDRLLKLPKPVPKPNPIPTPSCHWKLKDEEIVCIPLN